MGEVEREGTMKSPEGMMLSVAVEGEGETARGGAELVLVLMGVRRTNGDAAMSEGEGARELSAALGAETVRVEMGAGTCFPCFGDVLALGSTAFALPLRKMANFDLPLGAFEGGECSRGFN
jgi:hypothetical protein